MESASRLFSRKRTRVREKNFTKKNEEGRSMKESRRVTRLSSSMQSSSIKDHVSSSILQSSSVPFGSTSLTEHTGGTGQDDHSRLAKSTGLLIPMLESPLELLKPHTIEEQETEVFQNDSLPPVFDTELWESSENPDCTHRPPSSPSQRRATQRASKFFLEPRSRKEGDLDFLKLGEESVPAKRRRLVGSFVSLDAEVRCQGNDEVVVRMCDPYQSNYSSIENADVPPFEDETITLPTAFRPTIQLLGSNNRKGGNGDKLGSDFKPSKGSAFSTSSPQGLRKYGESVK